MNEGRYKVLKVKAQGVKTCGDSELGVRISWVLLSADSVEGMSDAEVCGRLGMARHCTGPGQPFAGEPGVWRVNHRVLITQSLGHDV